MRRILSICTFITLFFHPFLSYSQDAEKKQIESNFARDVLMPIFLPTVTSFHAIRESLFFNMRIKGGSPLESVGNFFLIPSHYLFGGRTIKIRGSVEEYELKPAFRYDKMHWVKMTASFIALPFSGTLGPLFKGLAYLSPEVRRRHRKLKRAFKALKIKDHRETYQRLGIETLLSEKIIPCLQLKRPSNLLKRQHTEITILKEIATLLNAHNITWWIDCGTALGAYRYGGMIPWDWDIDISILLPDHDNVKRLLQTLDPKKYQIQDWSSYSHPGTFLKLFVKETKNFIDIYHYTVYPENKTLAYFFTFKDTPIPHSWKTTELKCITPLKYEEIFPLRKASFDGVDVWAPNDIVAFLKSKYGENLEPAKVWNEEKLCYEKVVGHPYYDE